MILSALKWVRRKLVLRGWIDHIRTMLMWFGGISIIYLVLTQNMREGRTVYRYSDVDVESIGDGGGVRLESVTDRGGIAATQSGGIDDIHYEGGCLRPGLSESFI